MNTLRGGWMAVSLVLVAGLGVAAPVCAAAEVAASAVERSAKHAATLGLLEIEGTVKDSSSGLAALLGGGKPTLPGLVEALRKAGTRDDLEGVVIRLKDAKLSATQVQELGAAIKSVREAGKKVHLYAYGYDTPEVLLGSYCDEVIVQKGGAVSLPGIHMEEMFLADTLAWAGAKADFVQVGDYKGASEMLVNSKPSPQWDQNINSLLDGLYAAVRTQVKAGRKLDDAKLDEAMKKTFFGMAEQGQESGLVDTVLDLPELTGHLKDSYGEKAVKWDELAPAKTGAGMDPSNPFAILQMFAKKAERKPTRDTIAVVHIDGPIVDGDSTGGSPLGGGEASVGSTTIRRALSGLEDSKLVKGVVVRINSPGGSAIASEVIWQGLSRLREKGKPVWVSVGNMAASGGYYILSAGEKVYANPSSIVGSIGVVGGKIALGGTMEKLKVNIVERNRGPRAGMMSVMRPWTEEERGLIRQRMTEVYNLFTQRVTAGRPGIDLSKTAEGRLFTGEQAIAMKMVDKIGGLQAAIGDMQAQLGLKDGQFDVMDYPAAQSFEEILEQAFGMASAHVEAPRGGLIADAAMVAKDLLGPVAFEQLRQQMAGLWQMRSEPVVLVSPWAVIVR